MPKVKLPTQLREAAGGESSVSVEAEKGAQPVAHSYMTTPSAY